MLRSVSALIVLLVFWLLLSGHFTRFLIAAGMGSAIAVVIFARRMEVVDREGHPIDLWRAALRIGRGLQGNRQVRRGMFPR